MPNNEFHRPVPESQRSQMGEGFKFEKVNVSGVTFQIPNCLQGLFGNHDHAMVVYYANHLALESPLYAQSGTASQVCSGCWGTFVVSPSLTQAGVDAFLIHDGEIGKPYVAFRPFSGHGGG